ncbi:SHOCT domain-containing protein [Rhodoblastus sp.]|uniref:SHOCT domain-containing protein n=1 Tax=Rhodoblastus sp. TaxID=1962975 RepID=UPI00260283F5|nr:SHOCT domain-containing protein [Rhodoblastus sp.]
MERVSYTIGVTSVLASALAPVSAWAQQPAGPDGCYWGPNMMYWHGGWSGMFFGPLFMILGLAIAIALAIVIVRALLGPWGPETPARRMPPERTPLDILKERYARGEIDKEEFDERRRVLGE